MRALISLVLSVSILFGSVTPSLAQRAVVARQGVGSAVTKTGAKVVTSPSIKGLKGLGSASVSNGVVRGVSAKSISSSVSVPAASRMPGVPAVSAELSKTIAVSVDRAVWEQVSLTGGEIRALVRKGNTDGLSARILNHDNLAIREGLLRNEFVTLSLKNAATSAEINQAVSFYRADLVKTASAFAELPQGDLAAALSIAKDKNHASYNTLLNCHAALSDAAALGLLGSKADAEALVAFYKQASQSVFKDTAAMIAARGLLRQGAYQELNDFAVLAKPEGAFWTELSAFAQEQGLPVEFAAVSASSVEVPASLPAFLRAGCEPNALNANVSREATARWMGLGRVATPAAPVATAPVEVPAVSVALPEVQLAGINLSAAPVNVTAEGAEASAEAAAETVAPSKALQNKVQFFAKNTPAENNGSGTLYSGLPVGGMSDALQKAYKGLRGLFGKKAVSPKEGAYPVKEEPGLHDHTQIREVYSDLRVSGVPASADEVLGRNEFGPVSVAETGFKLTMVDEGGMERILPVNLEVSSRFRVKGYNRVAFVAEPGFKHGYVAELRNLTQAPEQMAHFYIKLQANQVGALANLVKESGLSEKFPLKLESMPDVAYKKVVLSVFDRATNAELPLMVEMPMKNYIDGASMILKADGSLALRDPKGHMHSLSRFYVRIPKNQIGSLVEILGGSPTVFNMSIHPTKNRAELIIRDASLTNVSLGKTMGPVVKGALGMDAATANGMMFTINYILPGLASLLTPILKKYGEKNLMVLSLAMSSAAGLMASAGGFYGFVEGMSLSPVAKGLFVTALFLMSGSSILKQLVSNMLIRANRGEAIIQAAKEAVKVSETELPVAQKEGLMRIAERFREFFSKKSDVSLKDIMLYNLSFVYKNVGTLAFLASPYLINHGIKLATGTDLGLDYSVSFPIYALYSGAVAWKVWRAKLRDAYSAKNLSQSEQMLAKVLNSGTGLLGAENGKLTPAQIDDAARGFKDALDAWAFANVKLNPSLKNKEVYNNAKQKFLVDLKSKLMEKHSWSQDKAQSVVNSVANSLKVQENLFGNMAKMVKAPGVVGLVSAMTLATVHEFVVSSSFASTMNALINQGEFANFLVACSLYVPLILGRLGGNLIGGRISPASMYLFCSGLSGLGTGMMYFAGTNVSQMVAGAAVASLGIGNFFTQMYDYIMNMYPKQNRELSSILALTMSIGGLGAIPAGYLAAQYGMGSDLLYAGIALGGSLILTPAMMAGSTLVQGVKQETKRVVNGLKKLFKRGGNQTPGDLNNGAAAQ